MAAVFRIIAAPVCLVNRFVLGHSPTKPVQGICYQTAFTFRADVH